MFERSCSWEEKESFESSVTVDSMTRKTQTSFPSSICSYTILPAHRRDGQQWRALACDALGMTGGDKHLPKLSKEDFGQDIRIKAVHAALSTEVQSLKGKHRTDFVNAALTDESWAKRRGCGELG